jgi:hypothetical protein
VASVPDVVGTDEHYGLRKFGLAGLPEHEDELGSTAGFESLSESWAPVAVA